MQCSSFKVDYTKFLLARARSSLAQKPTTGINHGSDGFGPSRTYTIFYPQPPAYRAQWGGAKKTKKKSAKKKMDHEAGQTRAAVSYI